MTALQLLHAAHNAEVTPSFVKHCSCVSGRQHSNQLHDMGSYHAYFKRIFPAHCREPSRLTELPSTTCSWEHFALQLH